MYMSGIIITFFFKSWPCINFVIDASNIFMELFLTPCIACQKLALHL